MNKSIRKHMLILYFILAYVITWIGSSIYYFTLPKGGQVLLPSLSFPAVLTWYYGPFLAAVFMTGLSGGRRGIGELLKRFLTWRIEWKWYAFISLYPLSMHLVVAGIDYLLGGPVPAFFQAEGVPKGSVWLTLVVLALFHVFVRGIGEETGWRGFALPHMQDRWGSLTASIGLGLLWAIWHFHPANFSALVKPSSVFFILNLVGTSVIFTWVYNYTHGSLLVATLLHMTLNVAEYVIPIGIADARLSQNLLQVVIIWIVALALVSKFKKGDTSPL